MTMDPKDIRTLKILESIENGQAQSQRDLARQLDVSLGLVNAFIKRLVQMGYFKVSTIPKNRIRYILTPKGAMEKTRLTYEFIHHSFQFYRDTRRHQRDLFEKIKNEGVGTVVLYGAKEIAEIAYLSIRESGIQVAGVIDEERKGKRFFEHTIDTLGNISMLTFDRIVIADVMLREDIEQKLTAVGLDENKVVWIT